MAGSNIFMQLITKAGPLVGEGLLKGWEGSVELREFSWGMHALKDTKPKASAGAAALSMLGIGTPISIKMEPLTFVKRFDVASAQIHTCLDNHVKIVSCSIAVLHVKQGDIPVLEPGFTLLATNGYFVSSKLSVEESDSGIEVMETVTLNFKNINIVYSKSVGKNALPTMPFLHPVPPVL